MHIKGTINHIEIPVKDIQKAKEFFHIIFDWNDLYSDFGPEYTLVNNPIDDYGVSIGLYKGETPAGGITPVIHVEDIEKTLALVEKNGGKIVKRKELITEEIGYSGYFEDIFGSKWGLFSRP